MARRVKEESLDLVERRGFNGTNATVSLVLVDADVERSAAAVKKCGKCASWRKGVDGKRARATKQKPSESSCTAWGRLNWPS